MFRLFVALFFLGWISGCGSEPSGTIEKYQCGDEKDIIDIGAIRPPQPLVVFNRITRKPAFETPTELVPENELPDFTDDLNFSNFLTALQRQQHRYREVDLGGTIKLGEDTYPLKRALESVEYMSELVNEYQTCSQMAADPDCLAEFKTAVLKKFKVYRPRLEKEDPRYGEDKPTLFTGYYTPLITVTPETKDEYAHAIYRRPDDADKARSERADIDFRGILRGQSLESFFGDNLFDLYLAHVQGNARVRYLTDDGWKYTYLNYDGTNGLKWEFISKYMKQKGMIEDGSIYAQRNYLESHPHRSEEVFSSCPSYVYLKPSDQPPMGSGNVSVTHNRSIATDHNYYAFKGLISFVSARRPVENQARNSFCDDVKFQDFSRFFLDQDTGGAIRGKARVDLYFGEGSYAELAASTTVVRGDLYFLMIRR